VLTRADRPWTNVYGIARSMLALATLLTLLANSSESLFAPLLVPDPEISGRGPLSQLSLFFLARNHLLAAKLLAIVFLLPVIAGWRPQLTAIPHWWVSFSFAASASVIDGGDVTASILSLLLVPVALTDHRAWHWEGSGTGGRIASIAAQTGEVLVRAQVAIIYLFAAVSKLAVEEWANGTALFYVWRGTRFGTAGYLRPLTDWLGRTVLVVPLTWSVLLLELCLAAALVAPLRFRVRLLPVAILFHVGIAVFHGLPTFALTMSAALVLHLRPWWRPFQFPEFLRHLTFRRTRALEPVSYAP